MISSRALSFDKHYAEYFCLNVKARKNNLFPVTVHTYDFQPSSEFWLTLCWILLSKSFSRKNNLFPEWFHFYGNPALTTWRPKFCKLVIKFKKKKSLLQTFLLFVCNLRKSKIRLLRLNNWFKHNFFLRKICIFKNKIENPYT